MFHDRGTSSSIFDRLDYSVGSNDTFHLNVLLARNRFEIPNTYEQEALGQDQGQQVRSVNIAPGYVHIFSPTTILTVNPYFRMDQVWYYPSANPFSDQTRRSASSDGYRTRHPRRHRLHEREFTTPRRECSSRTHS